MPGYNKGSLNRLRDELALVKRLNRRFCENNPAAASKMKGRESIYASAAVSCPRYNNGQPKLLENFYLHVEITNGGCERCKNIVNRDALKEHFEAKSATETSQ